MNIKQAKSISLHQLLSTLNVRKSHENANGSETWYFSPFRPDERTASFKVDHLKNTWFDFGHSSLNKSGSGGDIIDLWCDLHKKDRRSGIKEVLQELSDLRLAQHFYDARPSTNRQERKPKAPRFKILKTHSKIFLPSLKEELSKRRISQSLANIYLKQVFLQDTEKPQVKLNGLAIANDKGGFEISIPNPQKEKNFKTSTAKAITTIEGRNATKISVFEGFWDFLSWLEFYNFTEPPHTCKILNSISFTQQVAEQLKAMPDIRFVSAYLDNDDAGYQATHDLALALESTDIVFGDMSNHYKPYKDVNEHWVDYPSTNKLGYGRWTPTPSAPGL